MFANNSKKFRLALAFVFVVFSLTLGQCQAQPSGESAASGKITVAEEPTAGTQTAVDLSTAIARVAKETIPAVVHIEVTQRQEVANPFLPFENDPFFHYFFDVPQMPHKFKRELKGLGTGMIIDKQGHILTNYHVVGGADKIEVLLTDGRQYPAKVVGTDPKTDLAVIQISADEALPYVTFGDSDKLEVGDWVVAIGHPRGLDQTVTQGIISAKHRQGIMDPSSYQDYLQTDAAINPGNSGGPLLNLQGQVVGVNAAIASESGGFEGIGFAIPSNMAVHIVDTLIAHGKVERGWLGVSIQDLTPELAKSFDLDSTKGTLIAQVMKGGPAEKAGLKRGDVVISYDGKDIPDTGTLRNEVADSPMGKEVKMTVVRKGEKMDFTVKIGSQQEAIKLLSASVKDRLGVVIRPVTDKETQEYGLDEGEGVAIESLEKGGLLAEAGFEVGDVILQINGQPVEGVDGFVAIVNQLRHNQKIVLFALDQRTGQTGYVQVKIH
ncbi:MAG: DegQ family serine endoprotease [Deltaproteobacteria bacterium]|nr:DegQ family serine endoprotease [Deltaproteobacteria bacterium]